MRENRKQAARWSSAFRLFPLRSTLKRGLQPRFTHHALRITHHASRITCYLSFPAWCIWGFAADVDVSKLPPPATKPVEFAQDIKPIFERSCLRCHGPERPKSRFSLTTRESALKGGDNGVDIIPGDSAKSPLTHYVARLVEGMEMPPADKAEPLTPAEVGLLRAWIDRGAVWEPASPESLFSFTVAPIAGWTTVRGDEHKFREHLWMREGWNGGAESFLLSSKVGKESKFTAEGRALLDDYRVLLTLEKREVGFTRFGWEQYRKYFDDTGGYFPNFNPSVFSLDRDLHLDLGRAWADFGLTLPHWPRLVLGYEFQYRDGEKSTLQWGQINGPGASRSIYPAAKAIDEHVHVLKFNLDHEIAGVRIEDSFRGEFYNLRTHRLNPRPFTVGSAGPSQLDDVRERQAYFHGANTFRLEKPFTDWFLASAGYLYSKLDADAAFSLDPQFPFGAPGAFTAERWHSHEIVLQRESHLFNATALLGPWQGCTLSAGVLNEWTRQTGVGRANLDTVTPALTILRPATMDANSDTTMVEENVALRCTKIPFSVLYAEARLRQERVGQFEEMTGIPQGFARRTDASTDLRDLRAGFTTSPWRRISLNAHCRRYQKEVDYDDLLDQSALTDYPAFIRWRGVDTDEVETKLTIRPCTWLTTSFTYAYETTKVQTDTDPVTQPAPNSPGGRLESANSDAHRYSFNAALTPWRRVHLSGTFSWQNSRLEAFDNNSPVVVPYRGDLFSALASATCALNNTTDLHAAYAFSWADFGQDNFGSGPPLGIRYGRHALTAGLSRRITKNVSARLQYGFYHYDEPSGGGANNYAAHAVFGTLVVRIP